jgi:hypothetical protein
MNCHHSSVYTSGFSLELEVELDLELELELDSEPELDEDHLLLLLDFTPLISPLDEDPKELEEPDLEEELAAGFAEAAALAAGLEDEPMSLLLTEGFVYRF